MNRRHCLLPLTLILLAGCGRPQPPDTERRPDPQAAAAATEDAAKAEQKALQTTGNTP